jgi:hypothetical protein
MSFVRLLILIIGIYLAYRFVFHFLLPVYRTSKRMHQQFKGMQEKMNQEMHGDPSRFGGAATSGSRNSKPSGTSVNKDYIDFEEVK